MGRRERLLGVDGRNERTSQILWLCEPERSIESTVNPNRRVYAPVQEISKNNETLAKWRRLTSKERVKMPFQLTILLIDLWLLLFQCKLWVVRLTHLLPCSRYLVLVSPK